MKKYLSYGGGVNSTAMFLLLHDEGWEFEAIYVDHGCDWPETREYVKMMQKYLPITVLIPNHRKFSNLEEYLKRYRMIPSRVRRFCTVEFKVNVINQHVKTPCFMLIGFSTDEAQRAKLHAADGIEHRYPLLEYEIDRDQCIKIIKKHRFPVPIKSGCWFCPFQRVGQWRLLRRKHPDLFCRAKQLEAHQNQARAEKGKAPIYLADRPLDDVVREKQMVLFDELQPPCQCEV